MPPPFSGVLSQILRPGNCRQVGSNKPAPHTQPVRGPKAVHGGSQPLTPPRQPCPESPARLCFSPVARWPGLGGGLGVRTLEPGWGRRPACGCGRPWPGRLWGRVNERHDHTGRLIAKLIVACGPRMTMNATRPWQRRYPTLISGDKNAFLSGSPLLPDPLADTPGDYYVLCWSLFQPKHSHFRCCMCDTTCVKTTTSRWDLL